MTKNIIFVAIIMILDFSVQAQSYSIQRGHTNDDMYIYCRKNITSNSVMQFYHVWEYGAKISVQYTIPNPAPDNDLNLKNFVADPTPGMLFCTSLNNADTSIYQSTDFGKSWLHLSTVFNGIAPPIALLGGSVPGEIIMTERPAIQYYGIGSTTDFFATHSTNATYSSYFSKPEIGINSGEIYGIYNAYASPRDFLLHSLDFGVTIDTIAIDSAMVYNSNGNGAYKVCHGFIPGEIFLITTEPEQSGFPHVYKIYHSTNNGSTYSIQSELKFDESSSFTDFSGGRQGCSFYVVNWKFSQQLQRQIMQIYHSADCGQTFALWEYDLDEFVSSPELVYTANKILVVMPNPTQNYVNIHYTIKNLSNVSISIASAEGKTIDVFRNKKQPAGEYSFEYDCSILKPGIYIVELFEGKNLSSDCRLVIGK